MGADLQGEWRENTCILKGGKGEVRGTDKCRGVASIMGALLLFDTQTISMSFSTVPDIMVCEDTCMWLCLCVRNNPFSLCLEFCALESQVSVDTVLSVPSSFSQCH
jgi:hypothetical protein